MMGDEAAPHVSLALHPEHQAKELGSIVKRALAQADWVKSSISQVCFSPQTNIYRIELRVSDTVTLEHLQISRYHGRERADHPDATAIIESLPSTLWAQGPTDVGLVKCKPVSFALQSDAPIWIRQYPHKPQAAEGIADTIRGLLEKGC